MSVALSRTKSADRIDFKYYVMDHSPSLDSALMSVALRQGKCKLQLLDADGDIIATDRFGLDIRLRNGPTFRSQIVKALLFRDDSEYWIGPDQKEQWPKAQIRDISISPVFGDNAEGVITTALTIPRSMTLSLEEVKSVHNVKVELTFGE